MRKSWILSLALMAPLSITGQVLAGEGCDNNVPNCAADKIADNFASCCEDPCAIDSCGDDLCGPHWVIGTEVTFLVPDVKNGSFVGTLVGDTGAPDIIELAGDGTFNDMTFAPRVWIGRQGEDWGIVGRFWYLSDSNAAGAPLIPGVSPGFSFTDRLKAYTTDLEVTRQIWRCSGAKTTLSGGARYAELESSGSAALSTIVGSDVATAFANTNSSFDGVGLTFAINQVRPFGCNGWNVFWGLRGSVLFGDSTAAVRTGAVVSTGGGAGGSFDTAVAGSDEEAIFIGEAQLGLQWERALCCAPATAFVRIAGEYQFWSGGNVDAASVSAGGVGTTVAAAEAIAGDTDLTLAGFVIGTGLTW